MAKVVVSRALMSEMQQFVDQWTPESGLPKPTLDDLQNGLYDLMEVKEPVMGLQELNNGFKFGMVKQGGNYLFCAEGESPFHGDHWEAFKQLNKGKTDFEVDQKEATPTLADRANGAKEVSEQLSDNNERDEIGHSVNER